MKKFKISYGLIDKEIYAKCIKKALILFNEYLMLRNAPSQEYILVSLNNGYPKKISSETVFFTFN